MAPNGTVLTGAFERIMQPIYSSSSLATGGTSVSFFQATLGSATGGVWGSTPVVLADTNMTIPSALPAGYSHEVKAIALQFQSTITVADARAIAKGGAFQLKVASKDQFQIPIECLPGGYGFDGFSTTAAGAGNELIHWGLHDPRAVYPMDPPVNIMSNINFTARIDWAAAVTLTATQPIRCIFHGWLTRPVQ
jgi:hypothetical protein